jgi:tetratricopeptide (TPR) repeat protein
MFKKNLSYVQLFFLFFTILYSMPSEAMRYEFTPLATRAYKSTISLRFGDAYKDLAQMRLTEPDNLMYYYIADYVDAIKVIINEDKAEFNKLEKNRAKRLEELAKGPENSPYFLLTQAEVNLHWALARAKHDEYVTALKEVSTAYRMLKKNEKKFPDFIANKKCLCVMHAVIGIVPNELKWGLNLLNIEGTMEQGRAELDELVAYSKNHNFVFDDEVHCIYTFTMLYLGNQGETAWQTVLNSHLKAEKNPIAALGMANVALKTGHVNEAIEYLIKAPRSKNYFTVPYLDYYMGMAKLYRLDADANFYLKKYVDSFKGKLGVKETYQKLAWYELINGNETGYWDNMKLVKTKGNTVSEPDKAAMNEVNAGLKPDPTLLKARLLFDGGQNEAALKMIQTKSLSDYHNNEAYKLEYTYRLGRIYHKLKNYGEAVNAYQKTIDDGRNQGFFYACNAALQIGLIYEEQKLLGKARDFYNLCLDINPDEYAMGLHQKAKAGLARCK